MNTAMHQPERNDQASAHAGCSVGETAAVSVDHGTPHAHMHGAAGDSPARIATAATVHCLTGCIIGEVVGLAIGVSLGIGVWPTMVLATVLAYGSGFSLGLLPLVRRGMSFLQALRTIWIGEAISIGVMELAMNFTDYHMGGITVGSILHPQFWTGLALAVPAGFIAAWPVNWWLLKRRIKAPCH